MTMIYKTALFLYDILQFQSYTSLYIYIWLVCQQITVQYRKEKNILQHQ